MFGAVGARDAQDIETVVLIQLLRGASSRSWRSASYTRSICLDQRTNYSKTNSLRPRL